MSCLTCRGPVVGIIGNAYELHDRYPVHAGGTMNSEAVADVAGCHVGEGIIPNEAIIAKFLESSSVDTFSLELTVARARMAAAERGFAVIRNWTNG